MADNKTVRDGDNATFLGAAKELSDAAYSPKVTILDGSTSPVPITPAKATQLPATLGQKAAAASLSVVVANDQTPSVSATATQTIVSASASSVSILAANAARRGAAVMNDSAAILYLRLNVSPASLTLHTVRMVPGAYYEVPFNYAGAITGLWSAADGAARVTEFI